VSLRVDDVQKLIAVQWGAVDAPVIRIDGEYQSLVHPTGVHVDLRLTRADLSLDADAFSARIIAPAIAAMRKAMDERAA